MAEPVIFVDADDLFDRCRDELVAHDLRPARATWADVRAALAGADRALVVAPAETAYEGGPAQRLSAEQPGVELVLLAPAAGIAPVMRAVEEADAEFLPRDPPVDLVVARLRRAARHRDARLELARLRRQIEAERGFEAMAGTSPQMQTLFELVERAAATRASVLITGESGTGKELVARALHNRSPRRDQPFVAINCSAVPETLLESELFGHVRGAFTDAKESRAGLFVRANGGTLFLDEIGDMPLVTQPKLLRVLQERSVRPVGGDVEVPVDVRVVAATNRDLEAEVGRRAFREDLYYRLNVIHIHVPPLRERASDILLLAERFVRNAAAELGKEVTGISRAAAARLLAYPWPGNVRELQNCLERAVALTRYDEVRVEDLPPKVALPAAEMPPEPAAPTRELVPLDEVERRYIAHVLAAVGGNKKAAARVLGLDRKTLYRKIERYGLAAPKSAD
ncbi:MAG: sigma-54-dependent Fis family transcriptional regulator [Deltaproteobacteria bacterium]|nr:MAG: sigma-54-dependent Fis family transcriptional regulator [Deltaproteobacteria bacterium]